MGSRVDGRWQTSGDSPATGPLIVGICGGSGSGKTTLTDRLATSLSSEGSTSLSFDAYYRDLGHLPLDERAQMNFDHPDSLDAELLVDHLRSLRAGGDVAVPVYDFATYRRTGDLDLVSPQPFILVEGVLLFAFPEVRAELDVAIFRHCDEATRARRRLRRDVATRGRTPESVRQQWATTVQPMYERYVEPHAELADLVTTADEELDVAVERLRRAVVDRRDAAPTAPATADSGRHSWPDTATIAAQNA